MMSTTRPQGMIPPRFEEECVRAATSNIFNWKKRNTISYFLYTPPILIDENQCSDDFTVTVYAATMYVFN